MMKRTVGYWFRDNKEKRLNFDDFVSQYDSNDLNFVKIDINRSLESQGNFDIIIHKFLDLIVQPEYDCQIGIDQMNEVKKYCDKHPEMVMLDPLETIPIMIDRYKQYKLTKTVLESREMTNKAMFSPSFCLLETNNETECTRICKQNGLEFPIVCKPQIAHGETAHSMCIVFTPEGFKDIEVPCVAQTFINHNAKLFKIYIVGPYTYIFDRPSIKNLTPGNHSTLFFTTKEISKEDSNHALTELDEADGDIPVADNDLFNEMTQVYSRISGFNMYGIDLIFCNNTSKYAIIDVNCFPSYEKMSNFYECLLDFIRQKLKLTKDT